MKPLDLEPILAKGFGVPVHVTRCDRIEPWFVARCHLAETTSDIPRTVVVKSRREHPETLRMDPSQVLTEYAALSFLDEVDVNVAPRVLACDLDAGLLVLEDLAPRVPLAGILWRGEGPAADEGLRSFARRMGELHAGTAGLADRYYARRSALGPVDPQVERERFGGWGWDETRRHAEDDLGVVLSGGAEVELTSARDLIAEPGSFLALSNGDAGANNILVDEASDGRIIDWEFAGYRHALTDIACFYVPGPMWMRVGSPVESRVEWEYRQVLGSAIPQAADDAAFGSGLVAACHVMAIERLHRFPALEARAVGDDSRVQMVATLESAAEVAERHRCFLSAAGWLRDVSSALRRRWPDADVDVSMIPPYTMRR